MDRRSFGRLSVMAGVGAGLAGSRVSGQAGAGGKVGFAVIGLGVISADFMQEVAASQTVGVTAFVTGDAAKGREWAQRYNVPNAAIYSYETMAEMRGNAAVQAVYVGTPNGLHMRDVLASAKAGKHVLCEKPMATSAEECRAMIAACKAANVKLMIAYRMQYEPLYLQMKAMIASGRLGRIAAVEGAFGFDSRPGVWRLNKKMAGGGPLVDVGIYPLNAIRFLLGEEPVSWTAAAATTDTTSGRFAEVEESLVWTMKMASGALAACATSYGANLPGVLRIHGERGGLTLENAFGNGDIHFVGTGAAKMEVRTPAVANQLRLEAESLVECIRKDATPRSPGEEGLRDHVMMEDLYKAAGVQG